MRIGFADQKLPGKRHISFVELISRSSTWHIVLVGMLLYILPVVVISLSEALFLCAGNPLVYCEEQPAGLLELLYFNFVTIITIGYGDLHPVSWGRLFSVIEGIIGVGVFGLLVAAITTKLLSLRDNSVVFSRYGYYCTDEQRFLLVFVNTTNTYMVNVDMTSYFKLGGDWGVRPPIRTPFITTSVQTFFLDEERLEDIVNLLQEGDVFRFGISGSLGLSTYSVAVQYHADEIVVIPNRKELTQYQGFHSPDFQSVDISQMFHYRPTGSLTLSEYVDRERKRTV
ncbi:MAG: potassium channel family protein [Proteobacteria bacterium]|nr:potassium channel family protein [Pseudomonadota bacterium]